MQILGQRLPDLIPAAVQIGEIECSLYPATPKFNFIGGKFSCPKSKQLGRSGRQGKTSSFSAPRRRWSRNIPDQEVRRQLGLLGVLGVQLLVIDRDMGRRDEEILPSTYAR